MEHEKNLGSNDKSKIYCIFTIEFNVWMIIIHNIFAACIFWCR